MSYQTEIKNSLFKTNYFSIDNESLIYGDTQMMCNEITGFSYGTTITRVNGIKSNTEFYFKFVDSSNDKIEFRFYEALLSGNTPAQQNQLITYWTWEFFGNRILNEMINTVARGGTVKVHELTMDRQGVHLTRKPWFRAPVDYTIPWRELTYGLQSGFLTVKSDKESKAKKTMALKSELNAHVLMALIDNLHKDRSLCDFMSGIKR